MNGLWHQPTEQDQLRTLFNLGYFADSEWDSVKTLLFGSAPVRDAIDKYVDLHGISGDNFAEHTLRPRCGMPDFVRDPLDARLSKWRILNITTSNNLSGLNPLSAEREQAAWLEAIAAWNAVCGIRMTWIDDMNTANIAATPGSTGAGVLAYSYLPDDSGPEDQMAQVYNRSQVWSYNLLKNVIIHEIGHAIGLPHGPRDSIMQPTADGSITLPMSWDIQQAVLRYGQPQPQAPLPPPPTAGHSIELKRDLKRGFYWLEQGGNDIVVNTPISVGAHRVVSEFEMG